MGFRRQGMSVRRRPFVRVGTVLLLCTLASAGCGQALNPSQSAQTPAPPPSQAYIAVVDPVGDTCIEVGNPEISWTEASSSHLTVGQDLAISLVAGEAYVTDVFPWQSPGTSDSAILADAIPCSSAPLVSSLPVMYFLFRAVAPGSATITAPLAPDWSPPPLPSDCCPGLTPVTITVVVAP